ncbi:hypothetical protein EG328_002772 [Venturia inaequalis]|uniref:Tat pathway signal sequence n=1 Tax=Venturia inaequalis TaxID=5025 RepID=A0A8H3ZCL9_VENIN|nr:hypothetical protein EG328_002772 [Venturia inaequalis]
MGRRTSATQNNWESEQLLEDSTLVSKQIRRIPIVLYTLHVLLLLISICLFVLSSHRFAKLLERDCSSGPFNDKVFDESLRMIRVERTQLHGEFEIKSKFKGHPAKELDDAWDQISMGTRLFPNILSISHLFSTGGVFGIDENELKRINRSSATLAKFPQSMGGGYMTSLQVHHQLHCLNMIRKTTYLGYYKDDAMFRGRSQEVIDEHKDHCIDIIRQILMCAGDVNPINYYWKEGRKDPMPKFSMQHTCRRFDDIEAWTVKKVAESSGQPRASVDEPFLPRKYGQPNSGVVNKRKQFFVMLQPATIGLLTIICLALTIRLHNTEPRFKYEVYSPAKSVVSYENRVFTSGFGHERTEYQGPPSPERNALWDDLYGCKFIAVSTTEVSDNLSSQVGISRIARPSAAQLVNRTVPIPGDPGHYVVELNVFHQLHCLNMIRKRLYSTEEYPPDHELMGIEHLEHCYDALRQSLMCMADITPLPWKWVEAENKAMEVAQVAHTCKNFEAIKSWAQENRVVHFDRHVYVPDDLD